jgi:hypothetical protein
VGEQGGGYSGDCGELTVGSARRLLLMGFAGDSEQKEAKEAKGGKGTYDAEIEEICGGLLRGSEPHCKFPR